MGTRSRFLALLSVAGLTATLLLTVAPTTASAESEYKPDCRDPFPLCAEVGNPKEAFGNYYIGHDEPSALFYSNTPGSGGNMRYTITIPREPAGPYSQSKGYDFELRPAFWFGLTVCDTQSYPETMKTCTPDSDSNIVDVTKTTKAPGAAYEELQFYPPGYVQQFAGSSCDATKWCVALNIDSLSENPITGQDLNTFCQSHLLGGIEYVNFAFLTMDGKPLGPPNPLQFDPSTSGNPANPDTFFLNQGDRATVTLHDTAHGLETVVSDLTTGQTGRMVASASNGFGQIKFAPGKKSKACQMLPYDFHPMYSTSQPFVGARWSAHSYNVAFSDEIGHFDFCSQIDPNSPLGSCNGNEGATGDVEAADGDDNFCFSAEQSTLYPATGCEDSNAPGFDGTSYQTRWPDGTANNPTSVLFGGPRTGSSFSTAYPFVSFETDLPRVEGSDLGGSCLRLTTGANCVNPPPTDDGSPAAFYPYYSKVTVGSTCAYGIGSTLPNTINSYGGNSTAEFGPLLHSTYWTFGGRGSTNQRWQNFNSGSLANSC